MVSSNQLTAGMTINVEGQIYRVDSCVKVSVAKGVPFIKTKLKNLVTEEIVEKNFKLNQNIQDVSLVERRLEYLYMEGKDYLFLDIGNLEQVLVSEAIIGEKKYYLKEGIGLKAIFYGDSIFSIELPQFLELMVAKIEMKDKERHIVNAPKIAILETGARMEVPSFVEAGDIVKVDTHTKDYVQRV